MLDTIWTDIVSLCRHYPQILIFLSLAIGFYVGKVKIFGFSFGATASVLLVAIALGQMNVTVTPLIKTVAFALFIFTIGYKVGPHFFGGLKKEGINYFILSIFFAVIGLVTAILLGKLFGFDQGITAGLLSGALTQSSVLGTAEGAIQNLSVSASEKSSLVSNIAVAYAITYIFGVAGLILFYKLVPKFFKINLKQEAQKLEAQLSGRVTPTNTTGVFEWNARPNIRIYKLTSEKLFGKKVSDLEKLFEKKVTIEKIKRGKTLLEPKLSMLLKKNDKLLLVGNRTKILDARSIIGPEVDDNDLTKLTSEMLKVCVTKPIAIGKKLGQIISKYCHNCYVVKVVRMGHELPVKKNTLIENSDILYVIGLQKNVEAFAQKIGYPKRKTHVTDIAMLAFGCVIGTLIGLATFKLGAIPVTLGVGGGVLLAGLFFGWLQSVRPIFGDIPASAQWILTELGLNLFIACVGLTAGPKAISALQTHGAKLFFAGVALTLIPHVLSLIFGKFVLRLNIILLLGALTGAGTATPSLNVLKEESGSATPALGYSVPYAIGNFILTIWGTVIVSFM